MFSLYDSQLLYNVLNIAFRFYEDLPDFASALTSVKFEERLVLTLMEIIAIGA